MQARAIFEGAVDAGKEDGQARHRGGHAPGHLRANRSSILSSRSSTSHGGGGRQRDGRQGALSCRHNDRTAARSAESRRNCRERRVLLVRHKRSDADHARHLARRRSLFPRPVHRPRGILQSRPVRDSIDTVGVGELDQDRGRTRQRRPGPIIKLGVCGEHGGDPASITFCEEARPRLCVLLALPHPDRPPRRSASGAGQKGGKHGVRGGIVPP